MQQRLCSEFPKSATMLDVEGSHALTGSVVDMHRNFLLGLSIPGKAMAYAGLGRVRKEWLPVRPRAKPRPPSALSSA